VRTTLDEIGKQARSATAEADHFVPTASSSSRAAPESTQTETKQTETTRPISTRWEGTFRDSISEFSFVMHLNLASDGIVEGYILWRLLSIVPTSFLSNRIGDPGNEFVKGRVKEHGSGLLFSGYKVDEPFLLATDEYDVSFEDPPDHLIRRFTGKTRTPKGDWSGGSRES